jgi:CBS domain-containing protein
MADKDIGALLVVDGERLVGILSERDYARKVILMGKASKDTPVSEIMTSKLYTVHPDQTVEECMALMTNHRIRHLPVMDGLEIVGVISLGDVVNNIIYRQRQTIKGLEDRITSTGI